MATTNKEKLIELEREQLHVFHGSGLHLQELEPRQAYDFTDGVRKEDGMPAVFASHCIDYAIFMALINCTNCPQGHSSSCTYEDGQLKFGASADTLEQLNDTICGFVHVFPRYHFTLRGINEWVCYDKVTPDLVLKIGLADFDKVIEVMAPFVLPPGS